VGLHCALSSPVGTCPPKPDPHTCCCCCCSLVQPSLLLLRLGVIIQAPLRISLLLLRLLLLSCCCGAAWRFVVSCRHLRPVGRITPAPDNRSSHLLLLLLLLRCCCSMIMRQRSCCCCCCWDWLISFYASACCCCCCSSAAVGLAWRFVVSCRHLLLPLLIGPATGAAAAAAAGVGSNVCSRISLLGLWRLLLSCCCGAAWRFVVSCRHLRPVRRFIPAPHNEFLHLLLLLLRCCCSMIMRQRCCCCWGWLFSVYASACCCGCCSSAAAVGLHGALSSPIGTSGLYDASHLPATIIPHISCCFCCC
jgi:hypothetical protein